MSSWWAVVPYTSTGLDASYLLFASLMINLAKVCVNISLHEWENSERSRNLPIITQPVNTEASIGIFGWSVNLTCTFPFDFVASPHRFSGAGFKSSQLLFLCWPILSGPSILCSKLSFCVETSLSPTSTSSQLTLTPPNLRSGFHSPVFVPLMDIKLYSNELSNYLISPLDCKLYECRTYLLCPSLPCYGRPGTVPETIP